MDSILFYVVGILFIMYSNFVKLSLSILHGDNREPICYLQKIYVVLYNNIIMNKNVILYNYGIVLFVTWKVTEGSFQKYVVLLNFNLQK